MTAPGAAKKSSPSTPFAGLRNAIADSFRRWAAKIATKPRVAARPMAQLRAALRASATPVGQIPRPQLDRVTTLRLAARSTAIVGKVLDGISEQYGVSRKPAALIVRAGRIFWTIVEAAVPRSIYNLLMRYWFAVLLLIEGLIILGGTVLSGEKGVQALGLKLLLFTLGVRALIEITHFYLEGRRILRAVLVAVVLLLLTFSWLGFRYFTKNIWPGVWQWTTQRAWTAAVGSAGLTKQNLVLVAATFLVIAALVLWMYARRAQSTNTVAR